MWTPFVYLSLSAVAIWDWITVCCRDVSSALEDVEQHPWPLPTRCPWHPPLQVVTDLRMSPDIAQWPPWAKLTPVKTLGKKKRLCVSETLDDFSKVTQSGRDLASGSSQSHPVLFKIHQRSLLGASVRNSAHGKGHEEGGLAYAKA